MSTLIKFGNEVHASAVGGKNPVAAMIAQQMMTMDQLEVAQAQDVQAQAVGAVRNSGIQLG